MKMKMNKVSPGNITTAVIAPASMNTDIKMPEINDLTHGTLT